MSREYPSRPIAGVGVVVLRDDQVLMIRRRREPRMGQWSIPGGKQEVGETWRETATREVREETGVEIDVLGIVDVVDAIAAHWIGGEPVAGGDAAHAEWWPLDRLDELSLWSETVRIITEAAALATAARRDPQ